MLKPVQRLVRGLSKLLETNMQKQAYSNHGMHAVLRNNMHDVTVELHADRLNRQKMVTSPKYWS